jgi:hypothetical protein
MQREGTMNEFYWNSALIQGGASEGIEQLKIRYAATKANGRERRISKKGR